MEETMLKRVILLLAMVCTCVLLTAQTTQLVTNGSFETGDFTRWTPTINGTPFIPWLVSPAGVGADFGMQPTQPQDGQFDAWNGFDGAGPMSFTLSQDINVPRCFSSVPLLKWKDRVQWNFALTSTATEPRTYSVSLRLLNPEVTLFSFSTGTDHVIGDTGWQTHNADLTAYAGSTVRLWFEEDIPEFFTGPAQLEIDGVSANVADLVSIDSCCSNVPNRIIDPNTGLTLQQEITSIVDSCTVSAHNHGDFVSCVTHTMNDLKPGVITGQQKGSLMSCTARSARGKKY
jgi:hypothetical protein